MCDFEVYIARHEDEVLYIGEGVKGRHLHLTSGISHCYEANRYHFEGIELDIEVIEYSTKSEVVSMEKVLIKDLEPLWNKRLSGWSAVQSRKQLTDNLYKARYNGTITNQGHIKFMEYLISVVGVDYRCVITRDYMNKQEYTASTLLRSLATKSDTKRPPKIGRLVEVNKTSTRGYVVRFKKGFVDGSMFKENTKIRGGVTPKLPIKTLNNRCFVVKGCDNMGNTVEKYFGFRKGGRDAAYEEAVSWSNENYTVCLEE